MRGVQEINNPTQFNKATKNSRTAFKCFTIRKDKSTIYLHQICDDNQREERATQSSKKRQQDKK